MEKQVQRLKKLGRNIWRARQVYLIILPVILWFLIFQYWPMYWLRISFYDYNLYKGFEGSTFVGWKNFLDFFQSMDFWKLIRNVLLLNGYSLLFCFPAPIIFALFLNEMRLTRCKKVIQTVSFLPHFLSTVAFVALVTAFLSPSTGALADLMRFLGMEPVYFMGDARYFRTIMVISGIWQETGWSAVVFLSALSAIDVSLHEAALADGAGRWQRLIHVTLPGIMPTIIVMLILRIGAIISTNFEKIWLFQNTTNLEVSEVIQTWVYKRGMVRYDYSMGTTAGLFNGVVSLLLVILANYFSKKYSDSSGVW